MNAHFWEGRNRGPIIQPVLLPDSDDPLFKAVSKALSHARKRRVGLRGWKSSHLQWDVREETWDDVLENYVVVIGARPAERPQAPRAEWEYWLDARASILPGFPVVRNLPFWDRDIKASILGLSPDTTGPSKWDRTLLLASLVAAETVIAVAAVRQIAF